MTDLNRPKKETGLGSSLATLTSMSPVEVMEVESCFSDCFGLSQERGLFGEGDRFSFSMDDMPGEEEGRSDGMHLTDCQVFLSFLERRRLEMARLRNGDWP